MGWFAKFQKNEEDSGFDDKFDESDLAVIDGFTVSGPSTSGNLSVFFIHGKDSDDTTNFLTLEEALAKKHVIVSETSNVSELRIKNEGDEVVFIQSGDIVMGGKQDRTLQFDMILPGKSKEFPIKSFCVERGRWHQRGTERADTFSTSDYYLSHKNLRMAAKYSSSQQDVWSEVTNFQMRTATNAGVPLSRVQGLSESSLHQTMDTETVQTSTQEYVSDLSSLPEQFSDVIGLAFAINGKLNTIDVYSSNSLFKKMWSKLLTAAAMEAFAERNNNEYSPATPDQVKACMKDAHTARPQHRATSGRCRMRMQETKTNVLFETRDLTNGDKWVHRNYITK